ncbi:uncharacterized protein SOCEGT47_001900 [Sorangium cellulosum]|uniref:DUF2167 domain-containing protein n=1 Tax=Sorangium cellulosum TaxID=56 RepID=A0A4P2PT69_SORCE|nr:DUF2167 domain-containing protein [Sorangium cellulosum]AUX19738.1 uncharacterized protein SOCEGT47_001900 [Sorangium cellulosum]
MLGLGAPAVGVVAPAPAAAEEQPAAPGAAAPAGGAAAGTAAPGPPGGGEQEPTAAEIAAAMQRFDAGLNLRSGKVTVGDDLAELDVPEAFRFTGPEGAEKVLMAWGNPPGSEALGMLFPAGVSPIADDSWGVVISYVEEGHVEDDDAKEIDFGELLAEMQKETSDENPERKKAGFPAVRLVGWAEPPHYDAATRKLFWAKELEFEGNEDRTLNYSIRVLGRKGVLELNAVSGMKQLTTVRSEMQRVLGFVEFKPGNRYEDFNPDIDQVAAYGIGALVAGKVAAKAGLFKGLLAFLVASKKLVIAGLLAAVGGAKVIWDRVRGRA